MSISEVKKIMCLLLALAILLLCALLYAAGGLFCFLADLIGAAVLKTWRAIRAKTS